jgi:excisionase family DNA binding protein
MSEDGMTLARSERSSRLERMLLSPEEAAEVLGVGRAKVYDLMSEGRLASIKLGRCRRIPMASIRRLVEPSRESA